MPIYEFYCRDCHRLFSFLARTTGTRKRPRCPKCGRRGLDKRPSRFAVVRRTEAQDDASPAGAEAFDEAAMERAMDAVAREAEALDDDDPRQAGRLMRRLYEESGMPMDRAVGEAIRRMEAGEDPERIDEELGCAFDDAHGEEPRSRLRRIARATFPPTVDPTLYEL